MNLLRRALYWVATALLIATAIVMAGMVLGALAYGLLGPLLGSELDFPHRLAAGASLGRRYAQVWAGGLAFVLCFVKAHEKFSLRAWLKAKRKPTP